MPRDLAQLHRSPQTPELTASPAQMPTPERDAAMSSPDQRWQDVDVNSPERPQPASNNANPMALPDTADPSNQANGIPADDLQAAQAMSDRSSSEDMDASGEPLHHSHAHEGQYAENMGMLDPDMIMDEWPNRHNGMDGSALQDADVVNMLRRFDEHEPLHPYVSTLSAKDVEACVALEDAAFPKDERGSREKFQYRLTVCPDLCLGLFTSTNREPDDETRACFAAARVPDSANPNHKSLLIGHVIATQTIADAVTDESIMYPPEFFRPSSGRPVAPEKPSPPSSNVVQSSSLDGASDEKPPPVPAKDPPPVPSKDAFPVADQRANAPGHHPVGRTLAIHSVCILPPFQHLNLGKILFRSYLQRMEGAGIADTAALLARPEIASWYTNCFGFIDKGVSSATIAGGGWRDLRIDFHEPMSSM